MPEESTTAIVRAQGLAKSYGPVVAVAGVDFEIRRGICFGFLGPNGAGKSTTMRMLYRATPLGGGRLRLFGREVGDGRHDRWFKARLGVVPQQDNLDPALTARGNLEVFARFYPMARAARRARVERLLAEAGLSERAAAPIEELSGGMRRRLLIARGLLGEPELLILDEPTTGLDPKARNACWAQLGALKRSGATLVLTTHYMEEAARLCDELVIMDRGRIVACGTPADLVARHVEPEVVELEADTAGLVAEAAARLAGRYRRAGTLGARVLLYTERGRALVEDVRALGLPVRTTLRPSHLEDVFLALTGHGLDEEAGDGAGGGPAAGAEVRP